MCIRDRGKTTAALGLALRAAGNGVPVMIARFLKNDGSGEVGILENVPGVYLFPCERQFGFTWTMSEAQKVEAGEYFTGLFLSLIHILEAFYAAAKDADYIIYNSTIDGELKSLDALLAKSSLLADFKAVKEGHVWCTDCLLYTSRCV